MNIDLTSDLTMEQLTALDELKRRMGDQVKEEYRKDDAMFLRFLRARDYNVNKAEVMLRNDVEWRAKNNVDTIRHSFAVPKVIKFFPMTKPAYDVDGHPVIYLDVGNMDLKGLLKCVTKYEAVMAVVYLLEGYAEEMKQISIKLGKLVDSWTFVLNFENYSLTQATHKQSTVTHTAVCPSDLQLPAVQCELLLVLNVITTMSFWQPLELGLEVITLLLMTYEAHFPERLKKAVIINASIYFTILFAVIKPLLNANTVRKISVFGKDGYQAMLRELVNPDELPAFLGGNKTDPDGNPDCVSFVKHGCPVPKEYYIRSPENRLAYQPGVKKYSVSRKSAVNVVLHVTEPGSQIEWEFETESRDIAFGLYFKDSTSDDENQKPKELIPKQRVEAHTHKEEGMYQCDTPGTYILIFDNSYSWLSHKEIFCRASVVRPRQEESEVIAN